MNTAKLRSKRVIVPTIAAVAALGIGGVVWASTANAELEGSERDRVASAAVDAVGGGRWSTPRPVTTAARPTRSRSARTTATEVDVTLDKDLNVVKDSDSDNGDDVNDRDDADDQGDVNDTPDADDRALSASERASAEKAATTAVGGGTVIDVEASDDRGEAYEVEVRKADNTAWNVELDADFKVLSKQLDN